MHSVQQPQPCAHLEGGTYPSVSGVDKTLAESAARGSRRFNGGAPDVQNNWGIIIGGGRLSCRGWAPDRLSALLPRIKLTLIIFLSPKSGYIIG